MKLATGQEKRVDDGHAEFFTTTSTKDTKMGILERSFPQIDVGQGQCRRREIGAKFEILALRCSLLRDSVRSEFVCKWATNCVGVGVELESAVNNVIAQFLPVPSPPCGEG